ncbi:sensor histidine kinase [Microbispora triticiradicis]|uniref:sensor histidine kinase n=1 Tax=Microbispora triticiradicis TaxID=2200763 RepID=UPI001AD71654|nr:histidine kinase [Microbispora triticiradicis]MBO4270611.1 sensor histidine kinase [Microbispora triticiradicis]
MRTPRFQDLALWAAVCVPPAAAALDPDGRTLTPLIAGVPLFGVATALGRARPLTALAVPVALTLALDARMLAPLYWTWAALALFGYLAGRRAESGRAALWFFAAVALSGLPLSAFVLRDLWGWPTQLLTLLLAVVLPWLAGRWHRQYAELVDTGWRLADRMEREQRAVADRARTRERARIAGDMHDSLGHDLTLLAVRAGVLELDPGLDARQRDAVRELREAAAEATHRLREIIGVLREDDSLVPPREESVESLVERARDSGIPVVVEQTSGTDGLPPMAALAVRRVLQEALTNAARHAPGATVRVRLVRDETAFGVRVVNDAAPAARAPGRVPPGAATGGSGLVGLDERVRFAGGTLRSGPTPAGGFEVSAEVPIAGRGGNPPGPDSGDGREGSRDAATAAELVLARRRVRRRLVEAAGVPVAVLAVIAVITIPLGFVGSSLSVLDRETYEGLHVGDPRDDVRSGLPVFTRDGPPEGAPVPPEGQDCLYYTVKNADRLAYRLCFGGDRLVSKAVVP